MIKNEDFIRNINWFQYETQSSRMVFDSQLRGFVQKNNR